MLGGWCWWWQWLLTPPGALHWCFYHLPWACPELSIFLASFSIFVWHLSCSFYFSPSPFPAFLTVPNPLASGFLFPFSHSVEQLLSFGPPCGLFPLHLWSCVSVFDPWFKHLLCPWDGLALIKPSINLLSPLLKLPLMLSLLSLQFKHWA